MGNDSNARPVLYFCVVLYCTVLYLPQRMGYDTKARYLSYYYLGLSTLSIYPGGIFFSPAKLKKT